MMGYAGNVDITECAELKRNHPSCRDLVRQLSEHVKRAQALAAGASASGACPASTPPP